MAGSGGRPEPTHLVVGQVTKPHGMKGEVFVWPLTDRPDEVFAEGRSVLVGTVDGELEVGAPPLEIDRSRPFKRGLLLGFRGGTDRGGVEDLAGRYLMADRRDLAGPEPDEWYYHQLLGLTVETSAGQPVGRVAEVYETEPADLLDVAQPDGRHVLVPMSRHIVRRVDPAAGRIVIEPPDGLLEV